MLLLSKKSFRRAAIKSFHLGNTQVVILPERMQDQNRLPNNQYKKTTELSLLNI